jgi:transposase
MARKRRRRIWEDDEKRRIVAQTRVPGVSVSQVARRYDVNANIGPLSTPQCRYAQISIKVGEAGR